MLTTSKIFPKLPDTMRLLCAADLHLGRAFPHVGGEKSSRENFIFNAWENLISLAIAPSSRIDAVLLAGDIFDSEEDLYEAAYHFEKGVAKLAEKGIPVIAIAGNHDASLFAMRSFFSHLPGFHFLGKNGTWESHFLNFGQRKLRIDGWSFPAEHFNGNPLRTSLHCSREEIAIGLLHCECPGQKESKYAPVNAHDFAATGHRAWILGHVHIPHSILAQPDVFYCGSLQGLDSSEHSFRGAMLLDIDTAGQLQRHFCPLAPLLWHRQEVTVDPVLDLRILLEQTVQGAFKQNLSSTQVIAARFVLQGRVNDYPLVIARAKELEGVHLTSVFIDRAHVPCWIERIVVECQPAFDLGLLAQGEDILSQLARCLLSLQKAGDGMAMIEKARSFLEQRQIKYQHLASAFPLTDEEFRGEILRSGYALLADLMKQKENIR